MDYLYMKHSSIVCPIQKHLNELYALEVQTQVQ